MVQEFCPSPCCFSRLPIVGLPTLSGDGVLSRRALAMAAER